MSNFLAAPLNEMLGRSRKPKSPRTTKWVATIDGDEQDVAKDRSGLWSFCYEGIEFRNSRLGDLAEQIKALGGTVEQRSL